MRLTHGYSDNAAPLGATNDAAHSGSKITTQRAVCRSETKGGPESRRVPRHRLHVPNSAAKLAVLADDDADRHHERLEPGAGLCLHKRSTPEGLGGHGPPRQPSAKGKPGQQSTYRATIAREIRISNFSLCSRALRRSSWGDGPAHLSLRSRQISRGRESG